MERVNHVRCASLTALRACAVAAAMIAASAIAMPTSAESTTAALPTLRSTKEANLPVQPAKKFVSPYTRAAMSQHARGAHPSTGSAPTAMQAVGKPSRAHAPAKR
jgi:hypothetical protein